MSCLSIFFLLATSLFGADYYISNTGNDQNSGTLNQPWATFTKADSSLLPGDTVHVLPGTYTVTHIYTKKSGTAASHITWVSDLKWGAHLIGDTSATDYVWQSRGNYVTIQNFDVSGPRSYGIRSNGDFTVLVGNNVHNLTGPCVSYGGAGLYIGNFAGDGGEIYDNIVHDVAQDLNISCTSNHGIYATHPHVHIYNNISYRNWCWGIQLQHGASDSVISHNLVYQNGRGGISTGADGGSGYTNQNTIVSNNIIIYNSFPWSISAAARENDSVGSGANANRFLNNLFFGNRNADYTLIHGTASGTVDADPLLVNYQPDGSGIYRLTRGSPALDAGTTVGSFSPDMDGVLRPQGPAVDIGPYEFVAVPVR